MYAERPIPAITVARENDVHGPPRADRPLELALPAPKASAVRRARQLGLHRLGEKPDLHENRISGSASKGNVVLVAYTDTSLAPRRYFQRDVRERCAGQDLRDGDRRGLGAYSVGTVA